MIYGCGRSDGRTGCDGKAFDEFHLYSLARPATLIDRGNQAGGVRPRRGREGSDDLRL